MVAGGVPCCRAGRVRQDHDRKLEPLGFVDGHHPDALGPFLDDRRLSRLAVIGIRVDLLDEGSKR